MLNLRAVVRPHYLIRDESIPESQADRGRGDSDSCRRVGSESRPPPGHGAGQCQCAVCRAAAVVAVLSLARSRTPYARCPGRRRRSQPSWTSAGGCAYRAVSARARRVPALRAAAWSSKEWVVSGFSRLQSLAGIFWLVRGDPVRGRGESSRWRQAGAGGCR